MADRSLPRRIGHGVWPRGRVLYQFNTFGTGGAGGGAAATLSADAALHRSRSFGVRQDEAPQGRRFNLVVDLGESIGSLT